MKGISKPRTKLPLAGNVFSRMGSPYYIMYSSIDMQALHLALVRRTVLLPTRASSNSINLAIECPDGIRMENWREAADLLRATDGVFTVDKVPSFRRIGVHTFFMMCQSLFVHPLQLLLGPTIRMYNSAKREASEICLSELRVPWTEG